jgi:hypothetical protein
VPSEIQGLCINGGKAQFFTDDTASLSLASVEARSGAVFEVSLRLNFCTPYMGAMARDGISATYLALSECFKALAPP